MEHTVKMTTAAILFLGIIQGVMAEETTGTSYHEPAEQEMRFVRVKAISGRDASGQEHLLFSDRDGALLPLEEIHHAGRLINSALMAQKGYYGELQLQLADKMLVVDARGIEQRPLPRDLSRTQKLYGQFELTNLKANVHGHVPQTNDGQRLALFTN